MYIATPLFGADTLCCLLLDSPDGRAHGRSMKVDGRSYRTIWLAEDGWSVEIIDQTKLPHVFESCRLETVEAAAIQPLALGTHALPVVMPANTVLRRIVVQIFPLRRNKFVPVKP